MTCHCIIVVVAFTFLVFGNVFAAPNKSPIVPTTGQICKDGKGPLLEGEDSPFPCADECPDGFICEHPIEDEPLGICCPNLDILYELYGKNSAEEIGSDSVAPQTASTIPTTLNTKEVGEVHKFANSWQETSEVPEIVSSSFTETLPLERDTNDEQKDTPSPDSHLLKYLKSKELRLSQDKLPFHRALPDSDAYLNPINPLNPENVLHEKIHNETEPSMIIQDSYTQIKPNCKRQKYEKSCENGEKKTQIVLRWFAKNGECCSYPYGYCQGTLVKDDITLRTKEECEIFCLSNGPQNVSSSFEDSESESPFEMKLNKTELAVSVPTSNNVESVADEKVNNSTVTEQTTTNMKFKNEIVVSTLQPPVTVSFTDLVLNNNFSTTASFTDFVLSKNFMASSTASFIDFVLHNNSEAVSAKPKTSDSNAANKFNNNETNQPSDHLKSSLSTSESATTISSKEKDLTNANYSAKNEFNKVGGTEPAQPPSTFASFNSTSISSHPTNDNVKQTAGEKDTLYFEPLPPTPSPLFPTLANPIQGDVEGGQELEEVFPPGYGPEIDENNQTRVILHSDIQEPISIAPPNAESDAHAKELVSEMYESDTKKDVVVVGVAEKNVTSKKSQLQQQPPPQQSATKMPSTAALNELIMEITEATKNIQNGSEIELKVLKMPFDEMKRTLIPMKVGPIKSCMKILPYRSMCPSGMPSQFTLRWFVKAGMCCAYPFGYCHGELVFNEEAIKTKKECEELCLGKIDSEKPYHLF